MRHPVANWRGLAIAVATREAEASPLPGTTNGPADAYRHIVWVAEMTRRLGPHRAWRYAEFHEWSGNRRAASDLRRGEPVDARDLEEASAMDRRNNLIGIGIGQIARTFEDVLAKARAIMDRSPMDGTGGIAGAVWLPREQWAGLRATQPFEKPDWSRMRRDHIEDYYARGEEYRSNQLTAQERRAALRAERRADWLCMLEEAEAEDEASGGEVDVRAYLRQGHPVRAHSRSAPD